MALNIGQQDTQNRVQTCQCIAQAQIGAYRWRTGKPVDMPKATNAFTHRGKARPRGIGATLPIPRDAGIDQSRVGLLQLFWS